MNVLELKNVTKEYPTFTLDKVNLNLEKGTIMGFIGRNGSGKSTTLKAILRLISFKGEVLINGEDFAIHEQANKQNIGFILGGISVYELVTVSTLAKVTKRFYNNWDDTLYHKYINFFKIDEEKKIKELSQGMKVKINLAFALSHKANILILDEPTSGLDPVSRDEILDIFRKLVDNAEVSILFSTQIVSDLERCADYITYIQNGKIVDSSAIDSFVNKYFLVKGDKENLNEQNKNKIIGLRINRNDFEGIVKKEDASFFNKEVIKKASIEDIMIFNERNGNKNDEFAL